MPTALTEAARHARVAYSTVQVRIVVVADSCTDQTARIAASFPGVDVLSLHARTVGAARAEGVHFALAAFRHNKNFDPAGTTGWIANTDADSVVPADWFTSQLTLAADGADVVIGTVRPDFDDLTNEQVVAWTARHTPGIPNGHVHGANLGVRGSAYLAAGGFYPQTEHEDVDLVARLTGTSARIVASDVCDVLTSGRQVGKTPGSYARYLAEELLRSGEAGEPGRSAERSPRRPAGELETAQKCPTPSPLRSTEQTAGWRRSGDV